MTDGEKNDETQKTGGIVQKVLSLSLHVQIFACMALAVATVVAFKTTGASIPDGLSRAELDVWIGTQPIGYVTSVTDVVGKLFVKLLKMIIMPLVLASIVTSVAGMGTTAKLKRLGLKTVGYYAFTTFVAVVVGFALVTLVAPGTGMALESAQPPPSKDTTVASLVLSIVPDNVFAALANNSAILSVIVFGLMLGVGLVTMGDKAGPVADFFRALNDVMMLLTEWVMKLAPIGVYALLVSMLARTGLNVLAPLSKYMATVIGALAIHAFIVLPAIYRWITKRSALEYFRAMRTPLLTAFSTASSAATMPMTLEYSRVRGGVSRNVGGFVIPLGATVNMDGTALYEAVAVIFIAQAFGIDLSVGAQLLVVVTATLAAIGAAGVPSAGLVTMIIVLEAVNLPIEGYGLIVAVDRVLDMCRTTVNVWGDACGAAVLAHTEGELEDVNLEAELG